MNKPLSGKLALVTGGSRGIGRAISIKLASLGAKVLVNYSSSPDAADETVRNCVEAGGEAEALGFSVGDSAAVDQAFDGIKEKYGKIDILVNNAGISRDGLFIRMRDEDWHKTLDINLNGSFYCARAAAKLMLKAKQGAIINISSVVGEMGNGGQVPYVSSKAGLLGLTKAMARELASRSITVNAITPGFIRTDMTDALDEKLKVEHLKAIPLSRYGEPSEVASLVAFLAGPEAAYITGQVIGINGGMYM
ncbi:MAG: 3-oxoacyl-[acyl-carrier-protein] reductase [Oligoflexia bacterium]|nr:3-oxoacyl-[acyl-carrier-protein] reductase [Oligoflexia bacterium]